MFCTYGLFQFHFLLSNENEIQTIMYVTNIYVGYKASLC